MLYAILCYNEEDVVQAWSKEEDDATMERLFAVTSRLKSEDKLGPVARLLPTTAATTLRKNGKEQFVLDGPFAETKEQFLGFFVLQAETLEDAIQFARELSAANPANGTYEIRPLQFFNPGVPIA